MVKRFTGVAWPRVAPRLLLSSAMALSAGCFVTEVPCTEGTENCPCGVGGACGTGLECRAQTCFDATAPCTDGTLGCPCGSGCAATLECRANVCVDPMVTPCTAGTEGCPCDGGSCGSGLECQSDRCVRAATGPFVSHRSCTVTGPPRVTGLPSGFYGKYLHCSGIPILAPLEVPNAALELADETMGFMLDGHDEVLAQLERRGTYYVIRGDETPISDLPEAWPASMADFRGAYNASLGLGGVGTSSVENLFCQSSPLGIRPLNELVSTFGFILAYEGFYETDPAFAEAVESALADARAMSLYPLLMTGGSTSDYFAQLAVTWWEADAQDQSWATDRASLEAYDPGGWALVSGRLNPSLDLPGCIVGNEQTPFCEEQVTFDGGTYGVVRIDQQCWLQQNLRSTHYADGSAIASLDSSGDSAGYGTDPAGSTDAGNVYNLAAVRAGEGLCPEGYRVPSLADTQAVADYLQQIRGIAPANQAAHLCAAGRWPSADWGEALDTVHFSAVQAAQREPGGTWARGNAAWMWTTDSTGGAYGTVRALWSNLGEWQVRDSESRSLGCSVRCVRDGEAP